MRSFQIDFPDIFPEESPPALKIPLLRFLYVILDYGKLYGRSMHEIYLELRKAYITGFVGN